ncbi:hypothetical protein MLD38_016346 [Melastoma candidum]|uniref:Uncharacterized protein n=1 Tax=Melastoma candidum TaxID=119954 RepID=A0ACB9RJ87_9MYRT|nr:hypothetical protein MLD38_016346 [Melastoma candidum]
MGGLTSNRKRHDEFLSLHNGRDFCHLYSPEFRAFKKARFGVSIRSPEPQKEVQHVRTVSRVLQYPEVGSRLRRENLGPVRSTKFGSLLPVMSRENGRERDDSMGNFLMAQFNRAKASAFGTFRFLGGEKEKQVIDLVDEDGNERTRRKGCEEVPVVVDLCVEEIGGAEVVEETDERGRSAGSGSDYKLKDRDVAIMGNVGQESVVSELTNGNMTGLKDAEKMLGFLSLSKDGVEVLSKSAYKKLLEDAQRHDARIDFLDSQIKFNEEKWSSLQELRSGRKAEKEVPKEPFIPLTKEEEAEVSAAFSGSRRQVLVVHENSNIVITGELLQCLQPCSWLNDEVINVYLELLKEREKREPKKYLNCHFFNTFFYKKLIGSRNGYDYKSVRRWTSQRKLGYNLVECDKIFVPIHKEIHWCLAVINKTDQKFQYLDSLGGRDGQVLKVLAQYYLDEVKDKNGKDVDVSSWDQEFVEGLPEQENGFDCGMFMIKYADFYSRGLDLCFSQEHMPYFRLRTAKEILRLRAD